MRYGHILLLIFALGMCGFVAAQNTSEKLVCPILSVTGPSAMLDYDKPLNFKLDIDKKLYPNTKVKWTVSYGKILSGEDSESIKVENLSSAGMETIAIAEVIGLPERCEKTASASYLICPVSPASEKVDEFGKVTSNNLKEKIKKLSQKLKENPNSTAIIVKSPAKNANKLNVYRKLQLILDHLKSDEINEERINFQIVSNDDETTEFWLVSAGAAIPSPEVGYETLDAEKLKQRITKLSKKQ